MSLSDPIADMLTRIRNAAHANKAQVNVKASNICEGIASVLKKDTSKITTELMTASKVYYE